jgi:hypothetical protein
MTSENPQNAGGTPAALSTGEAARGPTPDHPDPYKGVKGWLKLFVVMNLYVGPVLFVLGGIIGLAGTAMVAEDYPGLVLVVMIETAVAGFLVWKWIQIAKNLRDIVPGVVQEAKLWLKIGLGWVFLDIPIAFMSGLEPELLAPGIVQDVVFSLISFAIWHSYFSVSKRVRATYPDWDQVDQGTLVPHAEQQLEAA